MYNVTMWRCCVTIVVVETNAVIYSVELQATVSSSQILLPKNAFLANLCLAELLKRAQVFMQNGRCFCSILTKFGICRRAFMKVPDIKFAEILPVGVLLVRADRRTRRS